MDWDEGLLLTKGANFSVAPDMAVDSEGNLNLVWIRDLGNITYKRVTPDNVTVLDEIYINTSMVGTVANPRIALGPNDDVHMTWFDEIPGDPPTPYYHYTRMDHSGSVQVNRTDVGGEDVVVDDDGNAYTYQFNRHFYMSPPKYADITYEKLDANGDPVGSGTVGVHNFTIRVADLIVDTSGGVDLVFLHDRSTLNFTRFDETGTKTVDQIPLLTDGVDLVDVAIELDEDGNAMVAYSNSTEIHFMLVSPAGEILVPDTRIWQVPISMDEEPRYPPEMIEMEGPDWTGSYLVAGMGYDMDVDCMCPDIGTTKINSTGVVKGYNVTTTFHADNDLWRHALGFDHLGRWFVVWAGDAEEGHEELFLSNTSKKFIDLAIDKEWVQIDPAIIDPGDPFWLNVTVKNLGNINATDFNVDLRYKDNGTLVDRISTLLDAESEDTVHFQLDLQETTNLIIHVDPLVNGDSNLTNNTLDLTVNITIPPPPDHPDLFITPEKITFSSSEPVAGEDVHIYATIGNKRDTGASATIEFYDGITGPLIGNRSIFVDMNSSNTTEVVWNTAQLGPHTILVKIEDVDPEENATTLLDNQASKNITVVSQPSLSIVILTPVENETVLLEVFNITGTATDPDGDELTVEVRVDEGQWAPVTWTSTDQWYIEWNLTGLGIGRHTVEARAMDDVRVTVTSVSFIVPLMWITLEKTPAEDPVINEIESQSFSIRYESPFISPPDITWSVDGVEVQGAIDMVQYEYNSTYEDSGVHVIVVNLSFGGGEASVSAKWNLTVLDVNRRPSITGHVPMENVLDMNTTEKKEFQVVASDPDKDELGYSWSVNGTNISATGPNFTFEPSEPGDYEVKVTVSDGKGGTVDHTWTVHVMKPKPKPSSTEISSYWSWILLIMIIVGVVMIIVVRYYLEKSKDKKGKKKS